MNSPQNYPTSATIKKLNRGSDVQQGILVPTLGTCLPIWQVNGSKLADAGGRSTALDPGKSALRAVPGCCRVHNINNKIQIGSCINLYYDGVARQPQERLFREDFDWLGFVP